MTEALYDIELKSLPLLHKGKVRNNYAVGEDRILMVATDRISAFDVVMNEPIPGKGEVLTKMSLFWFDKLKHIVPNHLTGEDPESVVAPEERHLVRGRSMLVKRLKPLPIEAVVRGYLAGSGWKEYQLRQSVCGVPLPLGLVNASALPEPIFTPATKAAAGEHDQNIDMERLVSLIGEQLAVDVRSRSLDVYAKAAAYSLERGIIIADTKMEFGLDGPGNLTLMDELITPDSSRFWPKRGYAEGVNPPSLDKQLMRDWLENAEVDGRQWNKNAPPPALSREIVQETSRMYHEVLLNLGATNELKVTGST